MQTIDRVPLTTTGRQRIEAEILRIHGRIAALRDMIADAHDDRTADDDERAAAMSMLDEQGRLTAQAAELRALLDRAIDAAPADVEAASLGTTVQVREDDGTEAEYTLVSAPEAAPAARRISVDSPLGRALLGARPGDTATVAAPSGAWQLSVLSLRAA